jgi:hypothetical protein
MTQPMSATPGMQTYFTRSKSILQDAEGEGEAEGEVEYTMSLKPLLS